MMKFVRVFVGLVLLFFVFPIVKEFYDYFTAPVTGLLVTAGADDWVLAVMTFIPWGVPIFVVVWSIIYLRKPDPPKSPYVSNIKFPEQ